MSATAQLALDVRGFLAGVDLAKQGLTSLRSESVKVDQGSGMARLQVAAIALGASLAGLSVAVYKGVASTVELGARLVDVSYKSGLAVQQIMLLERSMDEVGGKAEEAAPATDKFNQAIQQAANNAGPLVSILKGVNLTMEQLAGMTVAQRMVAVGNAIRSIANPAQQAEAAVSAFGASGIKMLAALDPKNLNSAAAAMGSQAQIMQANAGVFARIMQLMGAQGSSLNSLAVAVKGKLQGLFVGIASGVAPSILQIMEASATGGMALANTIRQFSPALAPLAGLIQKLTSLDLAGFGQQLGLGAAAIMAAIKSGDALSYIKNGLQIAAVEFKTTLNQASSGLTAAFSTLTAGVNFDQATNKLTQAFAALGENIDFSKLQSALVLALTGAKDLFVGGLQNGIASVVSGLSQVSEFGKTVKFENIKTAFADALKFLADGITGVANIFVGTIKSGIASALASIKEGLGVAGLAIPKSISVSLEKSGQEDITKGKNALLASASNAAGVVKDTMDKLLLGFDPEKLRQSATLKIEAGKTEIKEGVKGTATETVDIGAKLVTNAGQAAGLILESGKALGAAVSGNISVAGSAFVDATARAGAATKPELEMLADAQTYIADKSLAQAKITQVEMQRAFATPAKGEQAIAARPAMAESPVASIVSSLARIGGDVRPSQTGAIDLARSQLQAQQETAKNTALIAQKMRSTSSTSSGSQTAIVYQ